jgi:hypothetical protein
MLAATPLDEQVMLNVTYDIDTGAGKARTTSPLSRTLMLREAIRQSDGLVRTGASVSIKAHGATYGDTAEILAISARPGFFERPQREHCCKLKGRPRGPARTRNLDAP